MKVDFTKEVLKNRRWVLDAASERFIAARAGMTGKKNSLIEGQINHGLNCLVPKIKAFVFKAERRHNKV